MYPKDWVGYATRLKYPTMTILPSLEAVDYNALMSLKVVELQLQGLVNVRMDSYEDDPND